MCFTKTVVCIFIIRAEKEGKEVIHVLSPFLAMLLPLESRLTMLYIEDLEGLGKKRGEEEEEE